jgi:hypothetical protein
MFARFDLLCLQHVKIYFDCLRVPWFIKSFKLSIFLKGLSKILSVTSFENAILKKWLTWAEKQNWWLKKLVVDNLGL